MSDTRKMLLLFMTHPAGTTGRSLPTFVGPTVSSDLLAFSPSHTFLDRRHNLTTWPHPSQR